MPAPLSFLDALKAQAEGSAVSTAAPLTFGKALAQSVEKGHFRHADGKFRVGTPVALADLEDIAADVQDDDAGLLDAVAKFQAGEVPPPIDIAVDPEGNRVLVRGKKRLAAARKTGQVSIPVRFTQVKEAFGKAAAGAASVTPAPPRALQPIDDKTSYPPFPYDQTVFARLRPDQVPRFLGVLTDRERWPLQTVKLDQLLAMQNRVDTGKVMAKVENGGGGHEPIVVMLEPGRLHIADGHHDLAAAWLRGEDEKSVRFADLTAVTNVLKADMPVAPGTLVQVKEEHRADNWFLEQVGDALGEVIASWVVQEGENTGKVALAVEWLTPGICGMYRGLDAAMVVVAEDDQQGQPGDGGVSKGTGTANPDHFTLSANICKVDDDQRLVFGWFSIVEIDGQPVTDREGDRIAPDELEPAAYGHVLNARVASDTHVLIGVGKLVESCVFTLEKQQAMVASLIGMDIPAVMDLHCVGWWGGYYITDDRVWQSVKSGEYISFSIGGTGTRTPAAG
ncbi:XkdF-like putative serine protease domain-containing protein [Azospirillum aestuarii]|uniref:XkdF-like putative serine protease domain-containing protein n=1 Tax=Azospirillum aestuarii TaxID=2802052 RepID=UPI004055300B